MYSIFIKYNNNANRPLYEQYGMSSSTTGSASATFKPFETDDLAVLEETILALDKTYGHENLLICKVVEASYSVDVAIEEDTSKPTEPSDTVTDGNATGDEKDITVTP